MFPAFCFCIVEVRTPICERTFLLLLLLLLLFVFGSVWLVRKQRKVREKMESWILEKAKFVFGIVGVF